MSKTKDQVINEQNAQQPTVESLLQGDKTLTDKAAVVSGMFFNGNATPPVVYVQDNDRVVVVAPDNDAISELCETVTAILSANGYTVNTSGIYGSEAATGKVWQVISINH